MSGETKYNISFKAGKSGTGALLKGSYERPGRFVKKCMVTLLMLLFAPGIPFAQIKPIEQKNFFTDGQLIEMTLAADFKKLINEKRKEDYQFSFLPAEITFLFANGIKVTEPVEIRPRGSFRREQCYLPPVMINFKAGNGVILKKLGRLKLVWPCENSSNDEQLVLKEYLVYKIYNLLTDKSFRTRLVRIQYQDINKKIKRPNQYAFFIEDVDDMAKRNNCVEINGVKFHTESTHREQTTLVALFQYMIGNTDWAVPIYQNVKLIRSKTDSSSLPFVVPYDFDYCGLVNAPYAFPTPELPITSVKQRLYRGFPRSMNELNAVMQVFRAQRQAIHDMIQTFEPLTRQNKKDMNEYLDQFFEMSEKNIRDVFITGARKE